MRVYSIVGKTGRKRHTDIGGGGERLKRREGKKMRKNERLRSSVGEENGRRGRGLKNKRVVEGYICV